ncbi:methyltransferase domain-containing protein [Sphingomonas oligophenolica]
MDASEWSGPVGDVWATEWQRTDRSFAGLAPRLNAAAIAAVAGIDAPAIVDIGCGAGATSLALAAALPAARICGIDISPGLTAIAATRAADLPNLRFATGPVEALVGDQAPVDLFVSRHGVMFFADPIAAFAAIRGAAAPAGRLVFSCFRDAALNPWASELLAAVLGGPQPVPAGYAPGPFAFADPDFVTPLLEAAGWCDVRAISVDYNYCAGEGADPIADALDLFSRIGPTARAIKAADPAERGAMLDRMADVLHRHRSGDTVDFPAAAWLWSAQAAAGEAQ